MHSPSGMTLRRFCSKGDDASVGPDPELANVAGDRNSATRRGKDVYPPSFAYPYTMDTRAGMVRNPTVKLAVAVAPSSAFPPVRSPVRLEVGRRCSPRQSRRPSVSTWSSRAAFAPGIMALRAWETFVGGSPPSAE
jgi:hypothetical protein